MAKKAAAVLTVMMAGCGGRSHSHFETLVAHPETWVLTGLVDPSPESRGKVKARFPGLAGVAEFATLKEAFKTSTPAVVFISAASGFHYALCKEALAAGCHVICEKPLTFVVREAADLVKRAARAKRRLFVTQNYRHMPLNLALQEAVEKKRLGRVGAFSIRFHRRRDPIGPYSLTEPAPLLWMQAIHHFDSLRAVFGEVATLSAALTNPAWSPYENATVARVTFRMQSGVVGSYEGSYRAFGRQTPYDGEWRVECEKGDLLLLNGFGGLVEEHLPEEPAERHATQVTPIAVLPGDAQTRMIQGIATAIHTGKAFPTEGADNLKTLRVVDAILESARTNKVVKLG